MPASVPRVSVIVPVYNRAALIPATIESVWTQTYPDLEVVAVDDASTDGTFAVLDPELMVVYGNGRLRRADGSIGGRIHSPEMERLLSRRRAVWRIARRVSAT